MNTFDVIREYGIVLFSCEKTHPPAWADERDSTKEHSIKLSNGEYVKRTRTYWAFEVGRKPAFPNATEGYGTGECAKCEKAFSLSLMANPPEYPGYPQHPSHFNHPKNERTYKGTFSMGPAHVKKNGMPKPPSVSDILIDAFINAQSFRWGAIRFEDWAKECGYDEDSRKAETIFKACLDNFIMFRDMIGSDNLATILETWEE